MGWGVEKEEVGGVVWIVRGVFSFVLFWVSYFRFLGFSFYICVMK